MRSGEILVEVGVGEEWLLHDLWRLSLGEFDALENVPNHLFRLRRLADLFREFSEVLDDPLLVSLVEQDVFVVHRGRDVLLQLLRDFELISFFGENVFGGQAEVLHEFVERLDEVFAVCTPLLDCSRLEELAFSFGQDLGCLPHLLVGSLLQRE